MTTFLKTLRQGLLLSGLYACTVTTHAQFNLGFEECDARGPIGWDSFGSTEYTVSLDSSVHRSGKYSMKINDNGAEADYKALSFSLPHVYDGKKITLAGYIKTENVTGGWAGLWLRIDPTGGFDNMQKRGITGTTDWTRYEITLDLNAANTEKIVCGGLLAGKGSVWVDDLEVYIDNVSAKELKPIEHKLYATDTDTEFDEGSRINNIPLDEARIQNLYVLGLVWGFVKYHHPAVAEGKYHWDYELFRVMPNIMSAKNNAERDEVLAKWIQSLGSFATDKKKEKPSDKVKISPDLDWISSSGFSKELTAVLLKVKQAKRMDKHHYLAFARGVGNPEFKNEKAYAQFSYPDAGYRLLALYRYWNIIQYYFPYKNLIEEDWKGVLKAFIPKFVNAENEVAYKLATLELIARVHDTHANIWGRDDALRTYRGTNYVPLELAFVGNRPVVTGYYGKGEGQATGMQIGDVLTAVNGKPIERWVEEQLKYTPASNRPTQLRDLATSLLRSKDSLVEVDYLRDGVPAHKTLQAYSEKQISVNRFSRFDKADTCFRMVKSDIAYLYLGNIKNAYLANFWKEIKNTKGLVIDLRCYPSEFMVFTLGQYLLPKGAPFVKFSGGEFKVPGRFTFTEPLEVGYTNPQAYQGKVMILVNEGTQSQAEYTSMALRTAPRAKVIGSTTAGADGNVSKFMLPGGITTMISGIGVYYPDGKETQRIGIVPDVEVHPTVEGIKAGRDELLEKAIELIEAP